MSKTKKGHNLKGVPIGYNIPGWKYIGRWRENKTGIGQWNFRFDADKYRKAKSFGSHPKGRWIQWKIKGTQSVYKVGKGHYKTSLKGTKKLIRSGFSKKFRLWKQKGKR